MSSGVNNLQDMHAHLSPLKGSCWTKGGYLCSCYESLRMLRVKICYSNQLFLSSHTSHNNSNRWATMQHCFIGVFLFLNWLNWAFQFKTFAPSGLLCEWNYDFSISSHTQSHKKKHEPFYLIGGAEPGGKVARVMTRSFWECRCKQLGHRHQKQQQVIPSYLLLNWQLMSMLCGLLSCRKGS